MASKSFFLEENTAVAASLVLQKGNRWLYENPLMKSLE